MQFPIRSINDLQSISSRVKWQYFEKLVAFIFEENDFDVRTSVIIKTSKVKRQFDVIANKYDKIFLIECKKWKNKQRASALQSAVRKHIERCDFYTTVKKKEAVPLVVTLLDDNIEEQEDVHVVPIMKLNWFLNSDA